MSISQLAGEWSGESLAIICHAANWHIFIHIHSIQPGWNIGEWPCAGPWSAFQPWASGMTPWHASFVFLTVAPNTKLHNWFQKNILHNVSGLLCDSKISSYIFFPSSGWRTYLQKRYLATKCICPDCIWETENWRNFRSHCGPGLPFGWNFNPDPATSPLGTASLLECRH